MSHAEAPPPPPEPPRPGCALVALTRLSWALLVAVWAAQELVGERHWATCLLAYMPQHPFLVPPLLLLLPAWRSGVPRLRRGVLLMLWFAAVVMLGFQADAPSLLRPAGERLRVLTFNIGGMKQGPGNLLQVIESADFDLVCLQEVDTAAGRMLRQRFRDWQMAVDGEFAILTPHALIETQGHELAGGPRGQCQVATVSVHGATFEVVNVHFMTLAQPRDVRGDPRGTPERLAATIAVREEQVRAVEELAALVPRPLLVVGDFNTPPRGQVYRRLKRLLRDTFAEAGWGLGPTFRVGRPLWRIDYLWHSRGFVARRCWVPAGVASDHRPVAAELVLTAAR